MSFLGNMGPYDETSEDIDTYISRIEIFMDANSIKEAKKVVTFLTLIGPKAFHLIQNLVSPLAPSACTYNDLVKALKPNHTTKI